MNVSINLTPSIATWVKTQPDIEAAILQALEEHVSKVDSPMIRAARLLQRNVPNLPAEMEFEIPQILGREHWEVLDRSDRLALGKWVKRESADFGLVFIRKSPQNHAIYKRMV